MIYQPAEDSELLEEEVKKYAKGKRVLDMSRSADLEHDQESEQSGGNMRILDMGSGSGILAEGALKAGAKEVLCVDIDDESVGELRKKGLNAVKSDLFSNVAGVFDLIIFNPPYLPSDKREDKESALATSGGKRGDEIILRFLEKADKYLTKNGIILLLVSSLTPFKRIEKLLEEKKMKHRKIAEKKLFMEGLEVWEIIK